MGALIFFIVFAWITPAAIAWQIGANKGKQDTGALLGVFLGWLGVLIIAVMSPTDAARRTRAMESGFTACPFCLEMVRHGATACPHCQRDISDSTADAPPV